MGVDRAIDITAKQRKIVTDLLERHLPNTTAWVYGSRAKWASRPQSDLDLVVFATPEQNGRVSDLREALEESSLPFRVDLFVWDTVPEQFRKHIKRDHVALVESEDREVAGEWRETTLGHVVEFLSGGTPSKAQPAYWNGSVPWVSAKDMKRFRLRDTEDHVTAEGVANGTKLVPAGTVLLLVRGMTLLNDLPVCITEQPMTFNQDVKALRPIPGLDPDFLPYLVLGNKDRLLNLVDLAGHGTGRLNSEELKALDVHLPPEAEQRTIAHVLGTLDDKIELNRRMNETLEAMARALFKSWFLDFDPVRAKMAGRDTGLPKRLADLFPDRMVDSELGEIPEGWEVKTLGDLLELAYGKALRADSRHDGDVPVYGSNGEVGWHNKRLVQGPGIVVGRKGNPGVITWAAIDFFPIDTTFYVVPKDSNQNLYFLFYALKGQDLPSIAADSAVPGLNRNLAYMNKQVLPVDRIVEHFNVYVDPIFDRSHCLAAESRILAFLRDALLPKLISGEIRLRDGDKQA